MKKIIKFTIITFIFSIFYNSTFSLNTWNSWYQAAVYNTMLVTVTSSQLCRVVQNTWWAYFFIPTMTLWEFNSVGNHPNLFPRGCDARSVWWWSACNYNYNTWCQWYHWRSVTCPSWFCDPWARPSETTACWFSDLYDYDRCPNWYWTYDACKRDCSTTKSQKDGHYYRTNHDCYWSCDTWLIR